MKENGNFTQFDAWQMGYGALTYATKEKSTIIDYVKNQKEHHKTESFEVEFERLITENGIEFDEKFFCKKLYYQLNTCCKKLFIIVLLNNN